MQQVLIHRILLKRVNLANLKSDVDKLHIDKFKNAPSSLSSLKSKVDKLDIRKLETAPVAPKWCNKKWSCSKDWI